MLFIQVSKVDSGGDQDNYRIYIMTAAVQEMQYNSYVFIIHQTETVLYSQIRRNYIVIFIITRIAFTDVSRETLSYRSYNSRIHINVGDTFIRILWIWISEGLFHIWQ